MKKLVLCALVLFCVGCSSIGGSASVGGGSNGVGFGLGTGIRF